MGLFDDLGKRVKNAGQKSVQKTRELSEISRINSLISQAENTINSTYFQIGKNYVDIHRDDSEEALKSMVTSVLELENEIVQYKKQIQQIRKIQICSQCGEEISRGSSFCSSCGAPVPKMEKPQYSEELVKCLNCGAMIKKGMRFCTSCGNPMALPTPITNVDEVPLYVAEEENAIETSDKTCPQCGNLLTPDSIFCPECGYKL